MIDWIRPTPQPVIAPSRPHNAPDWLCVTSPRFNTRQHISMYYEPDPVKLAAQVAKREAQHVAALARQAERREVAVRAAEARKAEAKRQRAELSARRSAEREAEKAGKRKRAPMSAEHKRAIVAGCQAYWANQRRVPCG